MTTTLREAAQQALEALGHVVRQAQENLVPTIHYGPVHDVMNNLRAALAQQAEPMLQTCNCRWDGEVQVQQCTLHEAHVDAIHEWAERAKVAERKLAQQAEPLEPVAWMHNILEDNIIRHRPADLKRSPQNWTPLCNCAQPRQSDPQIEDRLARHGIPKP